MWPSKSRSGSNGRHLSIGCFVQVLVLLLQVQNDGFHPSQAHAFVSTGRRIKLTRPATLNSYVGSLEEESVTKGIENVSSERYALGKPSHSASGKAMDEDDGGQRKLQNINSTNDMIEHRYSYLLESSEALLASEPGSLVDGKWHEIVSMMNGWLSYQRAHSKRHPRQSRLNRGHSSLLKVADTAASVLSHNSTSLFETPLIMERLLKRLVDERVAGTIDAKATTWQYNTVMQAWSDHASRDTIDGRWVARRCRDIIVRLQRMYEESNFDSDYRPTSLSFSTVMSAFAKAGDMVGSQNIIQWMRTLHGSGRNEWAALSSFIYSHAINAVARSGDPNAGHKAEQMLQEMKEIDGIEPTAPCFANVMKAWIFAMPGRPGAEHSDRILSEVMVNAGVSPDVVAYSIVLNAWARSGVKEQAAERAEAILDRMEVDQGIMLAEAQKTSHTISATKTGIDENCYIACMDAWVKSDSPRAVERVDSLLQRMRTASGISPTLRSYNRLLEAHAKKGDAIAANDLLDKLEANFREGKAPHLAPSIYSYHFVLEAWSKCSRRNPDSASRALNLFARIVGCNRVYPGRLTFHMVLSILSSVKEQRPLYAKKANDILEYMESAYSAGSIHCRPNFQHIHFVILAWARSGLESAPERCEALLDFMETETARGRAYMKPTLSTYNIVIDAWAKSDRGIVGARKAEAILDRLQRNASLRPTLQTFHSILTSWAQSGTRACANKAEKYLQQMWELYRSGENEQLQPDAFSYYIVINAISKSKHQRKAQRALRVLRQLDKLHQNGVTAARPTRYTYNAVLESCKLDGSMWSSQIKRKTLDTAIFTLKEIRVSRYANPDPMTYGSFLKACASLMPPEMDEVERRNIVRPVFQQACRDGLVDRQVLFNLKRVASPSLFRELVIDQVPNYGGIAELREEDLPPEWGCNIAKQWTSSRQRYHQHVRR